MRKCSETVPFDPGIGAFAIDFNRFINDIYSQLMSFQSISMKRTRFRLLNSKIYAGLENNIAFYQGCLLWAEYLKNHFKNEPAEISGNIYLNMTKEELEDYDYLMQVNFIENYFDSYERDTLYYTGKKTEIPVRFRRILELYKEFLEKNKGFVNTRLTSDIILPEKIEAKLSSGDIKQLIDDAVSKGDLALLLQTDI